MEKQFSCITLEDDQNYLIIDEINVNETTYIYLTNEDNPIDFCIRKLSHDNNIECLITLDNEKEFELAHMYYVKKHQVQFN